MSQRGTTLIIILCAAVAIAALYMAPQKSSKSVTNPAMEASANDATAFDFAEFESKAKTSLQPGEIIKLDAFAKGTTPTDMDSAAAVWDRVQLPGIAATYFEKKAAADNAEKSYLNAAYRFFDAFKMANDSVERAYFVNKSIENYRKVLELNPGNLNAKTDLGVCYAEGTNNPMQGITLLREVVKEDPKHENAHLNLGFLSVKSGQYDKALERFNTVLKNNPARIDAYVFMGQTYVQMGEKQKAIESFETFKSLSDNDKAIAEIEAYLKELKTNP